MKKRSIRSTIIHTPVIEHWDLFVVKIVVVCFVLFCFVEEIYGITEEKNEKDVVGRRENYYHRIIAKKTFFFFVYETSCI